jgi:hypothetical protein
MFSASAGEYSESSELAPNEAQYKDIHERLKKAIASSRK